jgi:septal ring factor EnvC (AmiA/AmiB activator)
LIGVNAQSRQNLETQHRQTLREIAEITSFLKETQQGEKESLEKFMLLNAQIIQYKQLIDNIGKEIKLAEQQINETQLQIKQMNNEVEKLKTEYAQMVFHAYKNKGGYNKLIYVISAKDFNEAYRRMMYFQQYSQFRDKQVKEIIRSQQKLSEVVKKLAKQKSEKEKLLAAQKKETEQLEGVKTEQDKEIQRLQSQEKKLRKQASDKQRQADKLDKEIKKLIADEVKKSKGTSKTLYDKLTPEERLVSNNFKDNKGLLPWPTERGIITGFFGANSHPLYRDIKINNNGIDITTVAGAEVRTVFDGVVTRVMRIQGENITIFIRHGNFITVYMNLIDITVKQGDKVKAKEVIGRVYAEKGSKTAVLHFEIWQETNKLDPEIWMVTK